MNSNSPTHEEVSRRAQEIWNVRGRPSGQDDDIWHEAERQLAAHAPAGNLPSEVQGRGNGNSQSEGPGGSTPNPAEATAKAAQQKKAARAPKSPGKTAPKSPPPESSKPLWDKPHSS